MLQEDLVENVVQDPLYKCEEKQEENCHITFVTTFKSHSEEDCAEHFEKKCQIRKGLNLIFTQTTDVPSHHLNRLIENPTKL